MLIMYFEKMAVHHAVSYNHENLEFVKFLIGKEKVKLFSTKIKEDIVKGRQPRGLKLADLREIPVLWSEQLEKFYGFNL